SLGLGLPFIVTSVAVCSLILLLAEDEVNGPAAADVGAWVAEVGQDLFAVAAGVEQGVGQEGETGVVQRAFGHLALFVDALGQPAHRATVPGQDDRVNGGPWAEGVAEEVAEQNHLDAVLGCLGPIPSFGGPLAGGSGGGKTGRIRRLGSR